MNIALEKLVVDGGSNYLGVVEDLENLAGERAVIGFFGSENHEFVIPEGNLGPVEVNKIMQQVGYPESSIFISGGRDGSSYLNLLNLANSLNISTHARSGSNRIDDSRLAEDLISSYLENPEQSILSVLNDVLSRGSKVYGSNFVAKDKRAYMISSTSFGNPIFFRPGQFVTGENLSFLEDGTLGDSFGVTENGRIYTGKSEELTIPINPETELPYELNFMHRPFSHFIGAKRE